MINTLEDISLLTFIRKTIMKKTASILAIVLLSSLGLAACDTTSPEAIQRVKEIAECRANPEKQGCPGIVGE